MSCLVENMRIQVYVLLAIVARTFACKLEERNKNKEKIK